MKLTNDEQRALAFVAALLLVSAAVRAAALPEPVGAPDGAALDLDAHIAATAEAVAAEERRSRPLAEGERLDPNAASAEELDRLPGVGPALAERIVRSRESEGPFGAVSDLARVSGVGPRTVERLAPHLEVAGTSSWRGGGNRGSRPGRTLPTLREGATGRGSRIDLNRADVEALTALPGVGPVLAARIVARRDSAGPFPEVDSLVAVKGIGEATLARIRPHVRVR